MKHTKHWKKLKWSAIIFWSLFLLFVIIINGCTRVIVLERNITVNKTIETIKYINITTIEPCNITCPKSNITYDRLELIRRLKYLEGQQDKYINNSDCFVDLNHTNIELDKCKQELCNEWNSSWC